MEVGVANIETILQQYRQLNKEADEVRAISRRICNIEEELNANWKSSEVRILNRKIEDVVYSLNRISHDMTDFGHDYLKQGEIRDSMK